MATLTITARDDGKIGLRFPYDPDVVDRVRKMLARGWDSRRKEWWVPEGCAFDVVELAEELSRNRWRVVGLEFARAMSARGDALALAPRATSLADLHPDVREKFEGLTFERAPFDHQKAGSTWLTFAGSGLLGDDMGLGKSQQSIDAVKPRIARREVPRCVLIVPATLRENWVREIELNTTDRRAAGKIVVVAGTPTQRKKRELEAQTASWVIFNHEQTWRSPVFASLCVGAVIIVDEAHRFRNDSAKQTTAFQEAATAAEDVILLSGTPVVNKAGDLFNLVDVVEPGLLGHSYHAFEKRFATRTVLLNDDGTPRMVPVRGRRPNESERQYRATVERRSVAPVTGWHDTEIIAKRIARVSLRRLKADCTDLPPKTFRDIDFPMDAAQGKVYTDLVETLRADVRAVDLESDVAAKVDVRAMVALMIRLQQVSDGFVGTSNGPEFFKDGGAKFAALDEIVDEVCVRNGRKLVVWSRFNPTIAFGAQRYAQLNPVTLTGETRNRQEVIDAIQVGDCPLMFAQIRLGLGFNLTEVQDEVLLSRWWSPSVNNQAVDRCHRIGQRGTVTINSLIATATAAMIRKLGEDGVFETVDEVVARTLRRKEELSDALTGDAVAALIASAYDEPTLREILEAAGTSRASRSNR